MIAAPTLSDARSLLDAANTLLDQVVERASAVTEGGKRIDDHQVLVERVAYAMTEGRAARASLDFAAALAEAGRSSASLESTFAASVRVGAAVIWDPFVGSGNRERGRIAWQRNRRVAFRSRGQ